MKSYKPKRRQEISSETINDSFPKQFTSEIDKQIKLSEKDFWGQLLGSDNKLNQLNEESQNLPTKEKHVTKKNPASLESIVFEFKRQLIGEQADKINQNGEKKPDGASKTETQKEPGINYHSEYYQSISKFGEKHSRSESNDQNKQIQQIMAELKKLASSTKTLQVEFGQIAVETAPANPGKYYVNFFEWMLIMIRQAKQKVEDSKTWLDTVQGKSKKMGYWGKAKKHGTSFSQANERNVATSTG